MPSELTRERSSFFHTANRALTEADQKIYNTTLDSAGVDSSVSGLYRSFLPFTHTQTVVDTFLLTADPVPLEKLSRVTLVPLPGSNNQTWFAQDTDGARIKLFITEQFLLDPTTNSVPNAYVLELYQQDGTRITPTQGDWWVKPDEGLIRFEKGSTPVDLGWGNPTITCYRGILDPGKWRFYSTDHIFVIQHFNPDILEWDDHIRIEHDKVRIKGTLVADLNSFQLGDAHDISSGGEQIVLTNKDLGFTIAPMGSAVHTKNGSKHEIINSVAVRQFGDETIFEASGKSASTTTYASYFTTNNLSTGFFQFTYQAEEDYKGTLKLAVAYANNNVKGSAIYQEDFEVDTIKGEEVVLFMRKVGSKIGVGNPYQFNNQVHISLVKEDNQPLLVLARENDLALPWTNVIVRPMTYKFVALTDSANGSIDEMNAYAGDMEFAERKEAGYQTLHDATGFALADKDGNYITFKGPGVTADPLTETLAYVEDGADTSTDHTYAEYFVDPTTGEYQINALILSGFGSALTDESGEIIDFRVPFVPEEVETPPPPASAIRVTPVRANLNPNFVVDTPGNIEQGQLYFSDGYTNYSAGFEVFLKETADPTAVTQHLKTRVSASPEIIFRDLKEETSYDWTTVLTESTTGGVVVETGTISTINSIVIPPPDPEPDPILLPDIDATNTTVGVNDLTLAPEHEDYTRYGYAHFTATFVGAESGTMEVVLTGPNGFAHHYMSTTVPFSTSKILFDNLSEGVTYLWRRRLYHAASGLTHDATGTLTTQVTPTPAAEVPPDDLVFDLANRFTSANNEAVVPSDPDYDQYGYLYFKDAITTGDPCYMEVGLMEGVDNPLRFSESRSSVVSTVSPIVIFEGIKEGQLYTFWVELTSAVTGQTIKRSGTITTAVTPAVTPPVLPNTGNDFMARTTNPHYNPGDPEYQGYGYLYFQHDMLEEGVPINSTIAVSLRRDGVSGSGMRFIQTYVSTAPYIGFSDLDEGVTYFYELISRDPATGTTFKRTGTIATLVTPPIATISITNESAGGYDDDIDPNAQYYFTPGLITFKARIAGLTASKMVVEYGIKPLGYNAGERHYSNTAVKYGVGGSTDMNIVVRGLEGGKTYIYRTTMTDEDTGQLASREGEIDLLSNDYDITGSNVTFLTVEESKEISVRFTRPWSINTGSVANGLNFQIGIEGQEYIRLIYQPRLLPFSFITEWDNPSALFNVSITNTVGGVTALNLSTDPLKPWTCVVRLIQGAFVSEGLHYLE